LLRRGKQWRSWLERLREGNLYVTKRLEGENNPTHQTLPEKASGNVEVPPEVTQKKKEGAGTKTQGGRIWG